MSEVMVFVETNSERIHPVSYELLGKGRDLADKLGGKLSGLMLSGSEVSSEELVYRGADRVYESISEHFSEPIETLYTSAVTQVIGEVEPEIILIGATNFGRSLAPRVAMAMNTGLTADCTGLDVDEDGKFIQIRPAFSGNILAHITTTTSPQMSTVRFKEMSKAPRNKENKGEVIQLDLEFDGVIDSGIDILEERKSGKVKLEDADFIVAGGQGLKKPEDFEMLEELADMFAGKIGASRPLVDGGWIDRAHQVGYSGKRVKPKVYIAVGISGQSQHLAGMKDSDTIIAVNNDPSAPIFGYADYGIVDDLYQVLPEMKRQLGGLING